MQLAPMFAGLPLQARQKQTWPPSSATSNASTITSSGDSFEKSTQKSALHFAGGKERAKDGQESTLYKGYIVWQGNYLTKTEYQQEKAKNDAIWASLMQQPATEEPTAIDSASSPAAGSSRHKKGKQSTARTHQSKAPLAHSVSVLRRDEEIGPRRSVSPLSDEEQQESPEVAALAQQFQLASLDKRPATEEPTSEDSATGSSRHKSHKKGKQPAYYSDVSFDPQAEYLAGQSGKTAQELWEELWNTPSGETSGAMDENPRRLQQEALDRRHTIKVHEPKPHRSKHTLLGTPQAGDFSTEHEDAGYYSDTPIGEFLHDGANWWQKIRYGNRNQPGVYQPYSEQNRYF